MSEARDAIDRSRSTGSSAGDSRAMRDSEVSSMTGRSLFAAGDAKESRAWLTRDQEVDASKVYASSSCRAPISPTQGSGVGTDPQDELSVGGIETDSSLLELEARVVGAPEAGRSNVQGRGQGRGGRGQEGTGRAKEPCARFASETHKLELPTVDTSSIPKVPSCRTESRGASTEYSQSGSELGRKHPRAAPRTR